MIINTKKYIEEFLKIKDKNSEIIPLKINEPQMKLYNALACQSKANLPKRVIVLKARQMGFSTLTEAVIFKGTTTKTNITSAIVTHKDDATKNLYEMFGRFYNELPAGLRPITIAANANEMRFDTKDGKGLGSKIKCLTAGSRVVGRSDTINNLHISEFAFWGEQTKTLLGLLQAVPDSANTMIIIESTANGYDQFKDMWDKAVAGESEYIPVFCAWWELGEYRRAANDFTPTSAEMAIKELYGLDNEQLAWRRYTIANKCNGDVNLFKQEYPACPEEAFIATGESEFDKEKIIARINEIRDIKPLSQGYFTYKKVAIDLDTNEISDIEWVESAAGMITIHSEPRTKECDGVVIAKCPYAIGGDTSGEGQDYFTAKVIDNLNSDAVATLRIQKIDDDLYADQIYCLGRKYHDAIIGLEINYSIVATKELIKLGYPNIYKRESIDTITKKQKWQYGFLTTPTTRPVILAEFKKLFRNSPTIECDIETLREMLTFVKNERGKAEALQGKHDDLVMAAAIAHYISAQGEHDWLMIVDTENYIINNFNFNTESGGYMEW